MTAANPEGGVPAAERKKGYARWDGERTAQAWRWWVIAQGNLTLAWRNRWVKTLLLLSLVPGIAMIGISYFVVPLTTEVVAGILDASHLLAFLVAAIVGARLVSEDRRQGAFLTYFSRPVNRGDYMLGKFVALLLPLLFVTAVPALLTITVDASIPGETFAERVARESGQDIEDIASVNGQSVLVDRAGHLNVMGAVTAWAVLVSATTTGIVLGVSALADRARTAGILWFAVVAVGAAAHGILSDATGKAWPALLNWMSNLTGLSHWLLDLDGLLPNPDPLTRLAVLTAAAGAGLILVYVRLYRAEGVHR